MDRISRALNNARQGIDRVGNKPDFVDHPEKQPAKYVQTRTTTLSSKLLKENRIYAKSESSPIVDIFGLLRTRILKTMRENKWKTLGITSPNPSVGKTTTAINLAMSIALDHNYSVLLVDADLRRPGIAKTLGLKVESGLNDYLSGKVSLDEILVNPDIEHIVIAPTNRVATGSSEYLSSPKMTHFIKDARRRYAERIIIFDLPPVLVADDVTALSQNLDAMLLVVEDGKTQRKEMTSSMELLLDSNILGVVLNKGNIKQDSYNYY